MREQARKEGAEVYFGDEWGCGPTTTPARAGPRWGRHRSWR